MGKRRCEVGPGIGSNGPNRNMTRVRQRLSGLILFGLLFATNACASTPPSQRTHSTEGALDEENEELKLQLLNPEYPTSKKDLIEYFKDQPDVLIQALENQIEWEKGRKEEGSDGSLDAIYRALILMDYPFLPDDLIQIAKILQSKHFNRQLKKLLEKAPEGSVVKKIILRELSLEEN